MSMVEAPTAGQRDCGPQLPPAAAVTLRPPHRYNTP
jgi:hypothetical protein